MVAPASRGVHGAHPPGRGGARHRVEFTRRRRARFSARPFRDSLTTISPGHLLYGLSPLAGHAAEELGFRKAVTALRGRLIHVGQRRVGDDLLRAGPGGAAADATVGVVLLGMDNGYRVAATVMRSCSAGAARCPVLGVSAEYTVIDLTRSAGRRGRRRRDDHRRGRRRVIRVESLAEQVGAPSAAYWMVGLRDVPMR